MGQCNLMHSTELYVVIVNKLQYQNRWHWEITSHNYTVMYIIYTCCRNNLLKNLNFISFGVQLTLL